MSRPAVFIDRDGTLIEDADYLTSADEIRFLPGAVPALKRLHDAGYILVVVTNQSAVARGLLTEAELRAIHEALVEQVDLLGGRVDAVYYCPHLPPEDAVGAAGVVRRYVRDCSCRKPKPGLLVRAADELSLDLERSFAVGDAWRDVEAALAVGVPAVKLPRPADRPERPRADLPTLAEADTLAAAAEIILSTSARTARETIHQKQAAARRAAAAPAASSGGERPMTTSTGKLSARRKGDAAPPAEGLDFEAAERKDAARRRAPDEEPAEEPAAEAAVTVEVASAEAAAGAEATDEEDAEPEFDASLAHSPELDRLEAGAEDADAAAPAADESAPAASGAEENAEPEESAQLEEETAVAEEKMIEDELAAEELDEAEVANEPGRTLAEPPLMCGRCGAEIDEADLSSGAAGEVYDALLCRECYPEVSRMARRAASRSASPTFTPGAERSGGEATLDDLLAELRVLARRGSEPAGEGFNLARTFGLVAQALAVLLAVFTVMRGDWNEAIVWLLAAIFMQLLALTMFVLSRRNIRL